MRDCEFSVAMSELLEEELRHHLLRVDGQEDLTFALYRSIRGANRDTAMIVRLLLPLPGERNLHGNVSFTPEYLQRALDVARQEQCGIVFIHSHPIGYGWQGLSEDDEVAERRIAPACLAATALPTVGMTLAGDGTYSGRRWIRTGIRAYARQDAVNVRVVGKRLAVSLPPETLAKSPMFDRTDLVWGASGRQMLSRLRIGVVGLGSVGSIVAEALSRIGIRRVILVDHDHTGVENLDRTLNAALSDIGSLKVAVAADAIRAHAPKEIEVTVIDQRCDAAAAYQALLDCDFIFCCVDRPWGRRILNQLAYANAIPVSNGGLLARMRKGRFIGADWHVHVIGPRRCCMQCWGAFDPSDAALDRDGFLDDPSYLKELDPNSPLVSHANAMPYAMSVSSMQLMQFAAMLIGPSYNLGDWNFHAALGANDVTADTGCKDECPYAAMTCDARSTPPLLS